MQVFEIITVFKIIQFYGGTICGNTSVVTVRSYSPRYGRYCLLTILEKRKFAVGRKKHHFVRYHFVLVNFYVPNFISMDLRLFPAALMLIYRCLVNRRQI